MSTNSEPTEDSPNLSSPLRRNIETLRERRRQQAAAATKEERLADAITRFSGSMRFVYLHILLYGGWIAINLLPGLPHFDPTFVVLAMIASVEAIFLSTFVLISQNRAQSSTEQRNDLDLQINLLTEHELTKLIAMVAAISARLDVKTGAEPALGEITKDIKPEVVLDEIQRKKD